LNRIRFFVTERRLALVKEKKAMQIYKSLCFFCETAGKIALRLAWLIVMPTLLLAQTIIPADPKVPAPKGLRFEGTWSCGGTSSAAKLTVRPAQQPGHSSTGLGKNWTEIIQRDGSASGHYFVAYDRDKQEFMMIDPEDPAYAAYATDGWHDDRLTLTPIVGGAQSSPWYRLIYEVQGPAQFTISWELWNDKDWNVQSVFTCKKQVKAYSK
jgi:hypothetical protein